MGWIYQTIFSTFYTGMFINTSQKTIPSGNGFIGFYDIPQ